MLRIPHCLCNRLTGDGNVVSPKHRPRSTLQKHYFSASGTHFCYRLSKPRDQGLAPVRNMWRALVNAVMNLRVPYNDGILSTDFTTGGISGSAKLHRVP
jgi:hypothetical protein